jgi:putative flippase GtrA
MRLQILLIRYSIFACIATIVNLTTQKIVMIFWQDKDALILSLFTGTAAGLWIKYILDKRWIFNDASSNLLHNTRKFILYTAMGVITTLTFWGFEIIFWYYWETEMMRNVGAIIGIFVGYVIKYQLDKRFVFVNKIYYKEIRI